MEQGTHSLHILKGCVYLGKIIPGLESFSTAEFKILKESNGDYK